jgi:iron-sulfur cluster repair protein YtfE (RIC family)
MEASNGLPRTFDQPTAYLASDMDRLEKRLESVTRCMAAGELARVRVELEAFERGFARHMRIEEELLYPVFDARAGMLGGPTATLRLEHDDLRAALQEMRAALAARDPEAFGGALRSFRSTLGGHRSKEERMLFPAMERLLAPRERLALAERVQRE